MKRKLLILVILVIFISTLSSGILLTYFVKMRYLRNMNQAHDHIITYISETYEAMNRRGTYINDFHFVQNVSASKNVRITLFNQNLKAIADSENNTAILYDNIVKFRVEEPYGMINYIKTDKFREEVSYYSLSAILLGERLMVVQISSPIEDLYADVALIEQYYLLAISFSIIFTIIIGFTIINYINKPIIALTMAAKKISEGDYSLRLSMKKKDEIGVLSDTFDYMTTSIQTHIDLLNEKNAFLDALIGHMINGIIAVDEDFKLTVCNAAAKRALNLSYDLKANLMDQVTQDVRQGLFDAGHGQSNSIEIEIDQKVLECHFSPIKDENQHLGALCLIHDLTEKRKLEGMRKEFFTNVSHELRTPLTSIRGFVDTLEMQVQNDHRHFDQVFRILNAEIDRLQSLLNDMMRISEMEDMSSFVDKQRIDIGELLRRSISAHQNLADQRDISIHFHEETFSYDLESNEELFLLMISNMIANGIKYNVAEGQVNVYLYGDDQRIMLRFEDTGIGIEKEELAHIFQKFYRVEKSRNRKVGGAGLGLSIVKGLVDIMGGTVEVSSELGKGTVFTIIIPNGLAE